MAGERSGIMKRIKKGESVEEFLIRCGACTSARYWIKDNNIQTFEEAWQKCPRSDWMLWLYTKIKPLNKVKELYEAIPEIKEYLEKVTVLPYRFQSFWVERLNYIILADTLDADQIRRVVPHLFK